MRRIAHVTIMVISATIKKAIAYAYLPIAHTEVGTSVDVEFFGTWRSGVICAEPLFDPSNERIRL